MLVLHTVASLDGRHGGPSRSVPALVRALTGVDVDARISVADQRGGGMAREEVALYHDHGLWRACNHRVARDAAREGKPFVVSPRGMLEPWALHHRRQKKRIAWYLYQRRDLESAVAIHVTSDQEAESVRKLDLSPPIAIVPNGVDLPEGLVAASSDAPRTVLFLSRVHEKKGIPNLLTAWEQLRPRDWQLVIGGPADEGYLVELKALAAGIGIADSVDFIGGVLDRDKWDLYSRAALFVLPTFSENFGLVVGEALAAGTPVITTKGAPWSVLESEKCGWWIDVGVQPLVSALQEAIALSDDQREEMGRRGRALVEREFSWTAAAADLRRVYLWALELGPRPDCVQDA